MQNSSPSLTSGFQRHQMKKTKIKLRFAIRFPTPLCIHSKKWTSTNASKLLSSIYPVKERSEHPVESLEFVLRWDEAQRRRCLQTSAWLHPPGTLSSFTGHNPFSASMHSLLMISFDLQNSLGIFYHNPHPTQILISQPISPEYLIFHIMILWSLTRSERRQLVGVIVVK